MGTLLDLASLVVVPSGYKAGTVYSVVPTDGSGDLDFTRALDTATRVGPDGLIEKVRTNVVLQSNTFNTTWASAGGGTTTATIGATDPNGGATAWTLAKTGAAGRIEQFPTLSGQVSLSIFAKAGTLNGISISNDVGNISCNLTNGAIALSGASGSAVSVGNGWFRITMTTATNGNAFRIYPSDANGDVSGTSGNILIFNSQKESGDIATPYIPTTTASVSVGMLANVPRLDYTGGGCPKLLLEPQRTNLVTFSEQFDNAAWNKTNVSVTANTTISPDGYTNADTITANGGSSVHDIWQGFSGQTSNSVSFFVKRGTSRYIYLSTSYQATTADYAVILVDLDTQSVINNSSGNVTFVSSSVVNYGNGWYRITSNTTAVSATNLYAFFGISATFTFNLSLYGRQASETDQTAIFYGLQVEAGSYPTSYIPTLGAAVTRSADAAEKTGISALIGQTNGTLFAEFEYNGVANSGVYEIILEIAADANNVITLNINNTTAELYVFAMVGGVIQVNSVGIAGTNILGTHKVALAYNLNDYVCFLDGVQVFTDTSATVPTCLAVFVGDGISGTQQLGGGISQAILFPTRLTNTQCIELTTL